MKERWYDRTNDELMNLLKTDREKGLSRAEAASRLKSDGRNVVYPYRREPLRGYLRAVLTDLTALLLLAAALLGLICQRDAGMIVILVIFFINYGISIAYYIRAQRILEDLGMRALPSAKVVRGGKLSVIPSEELVMGDVILLSHGDIVPADARLLESQKLRVFEGGLFDLRNVSAKNANELHAGAKKPHETANMVYASTVVTGGSAVAVVVATGEDNLVCRMHKNRPIAACHKLDILRNIRKISIGAGILLLIPAFVMTLIALFRGEAVMDTLTLCLAFAVAAMPELYAAFAYMIVSYGMRSSIGQRENAEDSAFIKNPLSLPMLGETDLLFLPISKFRPPQYTHLLKLDDGQTSAALADAGKQEKYLRILRYGLVSTGLYGAARLAEQNERFDNIRSPEEEALIRAGEELSVYDRTLEERFPILDHRARGEDGSLFETTLVSYMAENFVVLRGEVNGILRECSHYCRDGRVMPLDADGARELALRAGSLVHAGLTPVAVATKRNEHSSLLRISDSQTGLTFEGFLVFEKPLLDNAALTITKLREAGVEVVAYSRDENEEYDYLSRALGIVRKEGDRVRASNIADQSEEVFCATAGKKTFFEGFDETQMRYIVELFKNEYGKKPGFFAERMEGVYPMYSATVGFAEEDGTTLGGKKKKQTELRSPLWMKKSRGREQYSCQALSHISDVILPPVGSSRSGGGKSGRSGRGRNGGINSIAAAIRHARAIYRNIRILILYLACTCGMRLTALLTLGIKGEFSAPQMLLSGLIFDLLAVFVIATERPNGLFMRCRSQKKLSRVILTEILPALAAGAAIGALFCGCMRFFPSLSLCAAENLRDVAFVSLVCTQAAVLTVFLRSGRPAFRNLSMSVSFAVYILFIAAFFAACFLFPRFGSLFPLSFPGIGGVLAALILPAAILLLTVIVRLAVKLSRGKKR